MPTVDLNGQVAIITGGGGGIGKAYAEALLKRGAKVCICDINQTLCEKVGAELESKFGEGRVLAIFGDVTTDESMKGVFAKVKEIFGRLDIMMNHAGINGEVDFRKTFETNFFGVIRGTELALAEMSKPKGRGGIIINTASIQGVADSPMMPLYSSSKAAVIHYTRAMGHSIYSSDNGVRVVAICPGKVDTAINADVSTFISYNDKATALVQSVVRNIPHIKPEVVGDAMLRIIDDGRTAAVMVVEFGRESGEYVPLPLGFPDPIMRQINKQKKV